MSDTSSSTRSTNSQTANGGAQLAVALERLAAYAGEFQRIGLSATVGNPDEIGRFLCGARPFALVEVSVASHLDISVRFAGEDFAAQTRAVDRCLDAPGSTLVFVNTRVTAEALGHQIFPRGDVEVHHGSLSRDVRVDAEERFRNGEIRTLIATSSMELRDRYRAHRARRPVQLSPTGLAPGAAGRPGRPPPRCSLAGHHPRHGF